MEFKRVLQYLVEAIIWYVFIYYLILTIKSQTGLSLWLDSLILLVLMYLGFMACPWTWKFYKHVEKDKQS